jgi:predicted O-methyltransferase YrrM
MKKWYSPFEEEIQIICDYATRAPGTTLFEVGSYEGRTTIRLARACPNRTVIAIDPWDGKQDASNDIVYAYFLKNIEAYPNISVNKSRSQDLVLSKDSIGFVFHDGDHTNIDFDQWYWALAPKGVLIVHDIFDKGWPKVREGWDLLPVPKMEIQVFPVKDSDYSAGPRGLGVIIK